MNAYPVSAEALRVWRHSLFGTKLAPAADVLLADCREVAVNAGTDIYRVLDEGSSVLAVVIHGLLRVYTTSEQGRQLTVRYVSDGDVYGLPATLAPAIVRQRAGLAVQAITDSAVLLLSPRRFVSLLDRNPQLAQAIYEELVGGLLDAYEILTDNIFLPVRMKIGRHLLDMAVRENNRIVVHVNQQNIADAIGSVREVVSRAMLRLRRDEVIARIPDGYEILDVAALHCISTRQ